MIKELPNDFSLFEFLVEVKRNKESLHLPDSFVLVLRYCVNFEAISYESTSLNKIVADKSHRVIVA